jgi:hypothetical protein
MQYSTKLKACLPNPAHDCLSNPFDENAYGKQANTIQHFGLLLKSYSREGSFASRYILSTEDVLNELNESCNP